MPFEFFFLAVPPFECEKLIFFITDDLTLGVCSFTAFSCSTGRDLSLIADDPLLLRPVND